MFSEDNEVTEVRVIDLEEKRMYIPSQTIQQNFIPMPNMQETPIGNPEPEVDPQSTTRKKPTNGTLVLPTNGALPVHH